MIRLRLKKGVNIDFINGFLNSYTFWSQIVEMKSGSAMPNVNAEKLKTLKLPKCDIATQNKIVSCFKDEDYQEEYAALYQKVKDTETIFNNSNQISNELTYQLSLVKNLRQQLLQDAVQGKLVKNVIYTEGGQKNVGEVSNLADVRASETGSQLLKRIKKEKAQLIKDKKLKKEKELPPIKAEEMPFDIPDDWVWCRLGEIAYSISTGPFGTMLHKSDYVENGIPLINPMNMINGKIVSSNKMMVNEKTKQKLKSYVLNTGDIVIGRRGEMGRCAIVSENENGWLCGTGSFFLQLHPNISREYFIKMFSSKFAKSILLGSSVGSTMDNLNHRILNSFPIPLPPLSMQHRIVEKVESLMHLCAALETSIAGSVRENEALLQQVLREALQGEAVMTA